MIDRIKIGNFLRELRNEKGITQEELAEKYGVSSRSVSRWENGNTLPELGILVELADYYNVEIQEMIEGERKSEIMEKQEKETLLKIADYAEKQKKQAIIRAVVLFSLAMLCCGFTIASGILVLKSNGQISPGYAVIPTFLTFVCSVALIINAKDYVGKK
jgi:transcriptional regulator with XRE-family HTH domain